MQTTSCTWPYVVPIGEDPAAHGHWCAFTDLYHTIPYQCKVVQKTRRMALYKNNVALKAPSRF